MIAFVFMLITLTYYAPALRIAWCTSVYVDQYDENGTTENGAVRIYSPISNSANEKKGKTRRETQGK